MTSMYRHVVDIDNNNQHKLGLLLKREDDKVMQNMSQMIIIQYHTNN